MTESKVNNVNNGPTSESKICSKGAERLQSEYHSLNEVNSKEVYNQLAEYTRIAKYAQYNSKKGRRETWEEQVTRVFNMHRVKLSTLKKSDGTTLLDNPQFQEAFTFSKQMMLDKKVLGSQRALQFGGPSILNKNTRIYNCAATYINRVEAFQQCMYTLLCGAGVGFSVQIHHIAKLPPILVPDEQDEMKFVIPDSIEGWADAVGVLVSSYFVHSQTFPAFARKNVVFDYSLIRPEGSPISHTSGKAPGHKGLMMSLEKVRGVLQRAVKTQSTLRPIDAYDMVMHISDAVLSGGVRRSATICMFSPEDDEMIKAKTGNWYVTNPQRARSNNSVILIKGSTKREDYLKLIESVKQFGEPGFIWADDKEGLFNPCSEISLYSYDLSSLSDSHPWHPDRNPSSPSIVSTSDGNEASSLSGTSPLSKTTSLPLIDSSKFPDPPSGMSFCNLSEINMKTVKDPSDFYERCKAASIMGTFQAAYTDFGYLGETTKRIVERESLIGVSMTGMMDTPHIAFNEEILKEGARIVKETNLAVAKLLGINPAARTTCVKPAGTSSCILDTSSGIHPRYAKRYFRRVQSNTTENQLAFFRRYNELAVNKSVWSSNGTDDVVTFLCKANKGAILKNDLTAIQLLEKVKLVQEYWVTEGRNKEFCVKPFLNHNVSNTINVAENDWMAAANFIYDNREYFSGVSMLPQNGDLVYDQAPFQEVLTHTEIAEKYGAGALFASGLIVHAHNAFGGNLYKACACLLGIGETLILPDFDKLALGTSFIEADKVFAKKRWVAQAKKFALRHFSGDDIKMTECLKLVDAWKTWCDLKRTYVNVPWESFLEDGDNTKPTQYVACGGGMCELITF